MEGGILLFRRRFQLWSAFILILSIIILPNHSFAQNPYKIEINKRTNHLYLYKNNQVIKTYRVGTGKKEHLTPEGVFTVGSRAENPQWYDRENDKIVPGGDPENPLGKFWLGLKINENDKANIYGIHGTNNEASVPGHVSKGCIRLKNKDIEELYSVYKISIGTPVWIHSGVSNQQWLGGSNQEEIKSISGKIITTTNVNIRQGLSTTTSILTSVKEGVILTVTGETKEWYRVKLSNGQIGFVSKFYVKLYTEPPNPPQQQPDPKPNTPPNQKTEEPTKSNVAVAVKTSFTKNGSLQIHATLSSVNQASGKWTIALNDQVIANEQNDKTSYTFVHKDAKLDGKQIKVKVEFNGTTDGKPAKGTKEITFNKVEETMKIKPTFNQNRLQIQASLKGHQKAAGIWIIELGETKRISLQSGEKLDEIFDEVTFDKKQFPVRIVFKGFLDQSFITAKYEKELKVNLSQLDETLVHQLATEKEDDNNQPVDENDPTPPIGDEKPEAKNEEEKPDVNGSNGEQLDQLTTAKAEDTPLNLNENDDPQEKSKEGGKLPKTASHYPLGVLIGLGIMMIGICSTRLLPIKK